MAAVSVQLSPHVTHSMASRRTPLSIIPNAANSPLRATAAVVGKRGRALSNTAALAVEQATAEPPPSKKQAVEAILAGPVTPRKERAEQRGNPATPAPRQHAARTREAVRAQKQENAGESMDRLRQWQKYNEKTFPSFVFFFENVPEGARRDCSRGVRALGAREAPFFSKDVTHVITTRAIPAPNDSNPTKGTNTASASPQDDNKSQPRTIDPAVLEKDRSLEALAAMQKSRFAFEPPRKPLPPAPDVENRNVQQSDILLRAKSMGMKIWGLDKLKRILDGMFDDGPPTSTQNARGKLSNATSKPPQGRPQDLQQLISNEQLHGPNERDAKGVYSDIIPFKGPYIYIRCCLERVRPIMVREWPRVGNRDDGEWPQFRSVSSGKCPFVEEDLRPRKSAPRAAKETDVRHAPKKDDSQPQPRPNALMEAARMQPPALVGRKRPLAEIENSSKPPTAPAQQLPPQCKDEPDPSRPGTSHGPAFIGRSGFIGGEPMASGMQASNITSAIRSQVISSTAAAPGAKAGTSREMHGLQRKVLERAQGPAAGLVRSTGISNLAGAAAPDENGPGTRAAKQRAQERLGQPRLAQVPERAGEGEDDEPETERPEPREKAAPSLRQKASRERREPRPGFCENCREKFDDFDEHTLSKRHRKFAVTKENWAELDRLLGLLGRPELRGAQKMD